MSSVTSYYKTECYVTLIPQVREFTAEGEIKKMFWMQCHLNLSETQQDGLFCTETVIRRYLSFIILNFNFFFKSHYPTEWDGYFSSKHACGSSGDFLGFVQTERSMTEMEWLAGILHEVSLCVYSAHTHTQSWRHSSALAGTLGDHLRL